MAAPQEEGMATLPRMSIDFRVPLWSLLSVAGAVAIGIASMYFQLARVGDDVAELKATLKSNNATTIQFAQEQALLKFRVEKLEQEKR